MTEETAQHYGLASRPDRGYGPAFIASVAVHVGLVVGLIALSSYQPPKLDLNSKPVSAHLVRLGEARNPKFLPRKDVTPPPPPKAFEVPKPTAAPRPRTENRAASLFDKVNRPTSIFDRVQKQPSAMFDTVEGSPQGSTLGDAAQAEGEQYYALLQAKIRQYFRVGGVPQSELDRLRAILAIQLDNRGGLLHVEVATSSGNATYDSEVISAVKRAAPFGPPPEHLRGEVNSGVEVEFRYK